MKTVRAFFFLNTMSDSDMESASESEYAEPSSDESFEDDPAYEDMKDVYDDLRATCRDVRIGHKLTGAAFCAFLNGLTTNGNEVRVVTRKNGAVDHFVLYAPDPRAKKAQTAETAKQ